MLMPPNTRNTLYVESAEILKHNSYEGMQYHLRLAAPRTAEKARPGQFIYLKCASDLLMRRPMSIMRVDSNAGWIDILYKVGGIGTQRLCQSLPGTVLNLIGPIGKSFKLKAYKKRPLLIGGGIGIPPLIFLAERIKTFTNIKPLVMMGSEIPFPFKVQPSQIMVGGIPQDTIACIPLLEDWGIPSRLSSKQNYAGCYSGYVSDLAYHWLDSLDHCQRQEVEIFACGPNLMLKAISQIAHHFALPCEVSLEQYMACAVGGCAGCTIMVQTGQEKNMQRVCVDGPVFSAASVFPPDKKTLYC